MPPPKDSIDGHGCDAKVQQTVVSAAKRFSVELAEISKHYRTFPAHNLTRASEHTRDNSSHKGTILTFKDNNTVSLATSNSCSLLLLGHGTYVSAGGLGGLGKILAKCLVDNGARNFKFLSRSGLHSAVANSTAEELTQLKIRFEIYACGIGDSDSLSSALEQ